MHPLCYHTYSLKDNLQYLTGELRILIADTVSLLALRQSQSKLRTMSDTKNCCDSNVITWLLVGANVWLAALVALMCYLLWGGF